MNKNLLFIDYESFFSSKEKYTLSKISVVEYVRSPRFKAFGMGVCGLTNRPEWIAGRDVSRYLAMMDDQVGWSNIAIVGHNIKFDGFILKDRYGVLPGQFIDTKAMSKAVFGKSMRNHQLATLATYFGLQPKGVLNTDGLETLSAEEEAALAEYCLHDVELCREIFIRLAKDFPENEYQSMHQTVEMFVNPRLQLNVPLLEKTTYEEAQRRAKIFDLIGIPKTVFASNQKFPALLASKGFDVPLKSSPRKKDEKGNAVKIPAIAVGDPEFLEMLESENEELKTLCEARVAAKSNLLETRSSKLAAIGKTGLWPFDVEFSGADQTHRFSGGKGAGGNPQNFTACRDKKAHKAGHFCPGVLRTAVESPSGYELVVGDFANIELRIVAYLSKDPGLVSAIEQGTDIYCDFASVFYGRSITKANERERRFGKTAILGLGYGMGWEKFIKTVRVQTGETISKEDSKKAVDLYRTRYSKVPALWQKLDGIIEYLADKGKPRNKVYWDLPGSLYYRAIILPSGLKIRYENLRQEDGEWIYDVYSKNNLEQRKLYGGKVLENISQALAGELCKGAMSIMGRDVVGQCHDELIVLCRRGLGFLTAQKLKRAMTIAPDWMPNMKLDAEVHVGPNWGAAK